MRKKHPKWASPGSGSKIKQNAVLDSACLHGQLLWSWQQQRSRREHHCHLTGGESEAHVKTPRSSQLGSRAKPRPGPGWLWPVLLCPFRCAACAALLTSIQENAHRKSPEITRKWTLGFTGKPQNVNIYIFQLHGFLHMAIRRVSEI